MLIQLGNTNDDGYNSASAHGEHHQNSFIKICNIWMLFTAET